MRAAAAILAAFTCACTSAGTQVASAPAASSDAASDATAPPSGDDGAPPTPDASDAGDAQPPCLDLTMGFVNPTDDCVYAGRCPESCQHGTASAYLCSPLPGAPDASLPTYPSIFSTTSFYDIIGVVDAAYPWDAAAYESCGALTCTRWSSADHVEGGSAWPADPCGDAGDASQAWACPASPGVIPQAVGCVGTGIDVGGGDSGVAANGVWCCVPPAH